MTAGGGGLIVHRSQEQQWSGEKGEKEFSNLYQHCKLVDQILQLSILYYASCY